MYNKYQTFYKDSKLPKPKLLHLFATMVKDNPRPLGVNALYILNATNLIESEQNKDLDNPPQNSNHVETELAPADPVVVELFPINDNKEEESNVLNPEDI